MTDQPFYAPVSEDAYGNWASPKPDPLQAKFWMARWYSLLDGPWYDDFEQWEAAGNNPYYAVVCATAFTLQHGYFRGYEHFRSVYFNPDSRHNIGVTVHKERTRTHIDDGGYVTDWYVTVNENRELNVHEQLYRGAVGILVSAEFPNTCNWRLSDRMRRFISRNELNIRIKEDADQKAQITSQG